MVTSTNEKQRKWKRSYKIVTIIKVFKVKLYGDGDNGDKKSQSKSEKVKKAF